MAHIIKLNRLTEIFIDILGDLNKNGYSLLPGMLSDTKCKDLIQLYYQESLYRKKINMQQYRFGQGEYKYFQYPLPDLVETLRHDLYAALSPLANEWMQKLQIAFQYPPTLTDFLNICYEQGQQRPTPLILKYEPGDYNTLHQDMYGKVYFPLQAVIFLSDPDKDYTGGEFILTEKKPRMQAKAMALKPEKGDILVFATNFRPVQGTCGYYKAVMKHGVSPLQTGKRFTLGIIFHDAL